MHDLKGWNRKISVRAQLKQHKRKGIDHHEESRCQEIYALGDWISGLLLYM